MKDKRSYTNSLKQEIKQRLKEEGIEQFTKIMQDVRDKYIKEITQFGVRDPEQSWKPFKGKLLEEILMEYLKEEIEKLGIGIVKGVELEKADKRLPECLSKVKRGIVVDFGEFGMYLPDADLIIYDPQECKPIAIISSKTTLRERIAQTGYWKLKLASSCITRNVRVFFITLDEDGDLTIRKPAKKGRAIAEIDTDGTYVIANDRRKPQESRKVKSIEKFLKDIKGLLHED